MEDRRKHEWEGKKYKLNEARKERKIFLRKNRQTEKNRIEEKAEKENRMNKKKEEKTDE